MSFVQYGHMTEVERAAAEGQRQNALLLKEMKEWMDVLHLRVEIWCRNGPSQALRDGISEASAEYGERLERLLGSASIRLTGPSR
jgi:hypothetical protein